MLVIASMVGTGIFTTSGPLLAQLGSIEAVLLVWFLGGLVALSGALCYAELASRILESGGEYALLARTFHPALGFAAGFVSLLAGFAAPIALVALGFSSYASVVHPALPKSIVAVCLVVGATLLHGIRPGFGIRFQDFATLIKVGLILCFVVGALFFGDAGRLVDPHNVIAPAQGGSPPSVWGVVSAFALGLVQVYYGYAGWNAAAYVTGEVKSPQKNLPLALFFGTAMVIGLYLALNLAFFSAAPLAELQGEIEIGYLAAVALFGPVAGTGLSLLIAAGLVSTLGALVVTGARVYEAMGRDYPRLSVLATKNPEGAPVVALAIQAAIAVLLILFTSFAELLAAVGFVLSISSALTVCGLFVARARRPEVRGGFRVPGYPLTPLFFVVVTLWSVISTFGNAFSDFGKLKIVLIGMVPVALGLLIYLFVTPRPDAYQLERK